MRSRKHRHHDRQTSPHRSQRSEHPVNESPHRRITLQAEAALLAVWSGRDGQRSSIGDQPFPIRVRGEFFETPRYFFLAKLTCPVLRLASSSINAARFQCAPSASHCHSSITIANDAKADLASLIMFRPELVKIKPVKRCLAAIVLESACIKPYPLLDNLVALRSG